MAGLDRFISIIRLFDEHQGEWTIPDMAKQLDVPTSTIYRNVRELSNVGFLEAAPSSNYRLGPAFVEFDRRFQLTDPLMRSGTLFIATLLKQVPFPCVVVLARLYDNRVMCTLTQKSEDIGFQTSYQKGHPMPLVKGATSKVILASLKTNRLKQLAKNLGSSDLEIINNKVFSQNLDLISKAGYCITRGEVDPKLVGVAAPIANKKHGINASLSIIAEGNILNEDREKNILPLLLSTAHLINNNMNEVGNV